MVWAIVVNAEFRDIDICVPIRLRIVRPWEALVFKICMPHNSSSE